MADLEALAEHLAATVRDLQAYIEARADEIAGPLITAVQERSAAEIEAVRTAAERQKQRAEDLVRELRRQLDVQVKQNERLNREVKETRAAIRRAEALKVWTNEDDKDFVFADELWAALAEAGPHRHLAAAVSPATDDERP